MLHGFAIVLVDI